MKIHIKFLIVILCCLTNCYTSLAQPKHYIGVTRYLHNAKTLDMANMRITYSLEFVPDSTEAHKKWKDTKFLLIGNSVQHFYSKYSRMQDSVATNATKAYRPYTPPVGECAERYDIYNNLPEGKQTVIENITTFKMFVHYDDLPKQTWSITGEMTTILNYFCYKAICSYRGRIWEVWFTMDIPINAGPWKLRGLPGLILKASDDRKHYVFECTGIEKLKNPEPIIIYQNAYNATSDPAYESNEEKFLNALKEFHENYVNTLLSMGYDVRVINDSGNIVEYIETTNPREKGSWWTTINVRDRYRKIPYNPIELEIKKYYDF